MPISPIGAVQSVTPSSYLANPAAAAGKDGDGFAASLTGAVDNLQQLQATSKELAIKAVTGDLNDIHSATLASTRAQVTLELVAAVRNKGVDAFNEIMRMQA
ncbi:MAG: flagellar hook-basal body complex protein FliE [Arthrobacter sp.]